MQAFIDERNKEQTPSEILGSFAQTAVAKTTSFLDAIVKEVKSMKQHFVGDHTSQSPQFNTTGNDQDQILDTPSDTPLESETQFQTNESRNFKDVVEERNKRLEEKSKDEEMQFELETAIAMSLSIQDEEKERLENMKMVQMIEQVGEKNQKEMNEKGKERINEDMSHSTKESN